MISDDSRILGVQFHPEFLPAYVADLTRFVRSRLFIFLLMIRIRKEKGIFSTEFASDILARNTIPLDSQLIIDVAKEWLFQTRN